MAKVEMYYFMPKKLGDLATFTNSLVSAQAGVQSECGLKTKVFTTYRSDIMRKVIIEDEDEGKVQKAIGKYLAAVGKPADTEGNSDIYKKLLDMEEEQQDE